MSRRTRAVADPAEARQTAARVAFSFALLGLAAVEIVQDVVRRATWFGQPPLQNSVVFLHVPLWFLAAAAVWMRRDTAWLGILPGLLSLALHGLVAHLGGSASGALFLAAAPVLLLLAWQGRRPHPVARLRLLRVLHTRGGGGAPR